MNAYLNIRHYWFRVTEIASQFAELDKDTKGHVDRDTVKESLKDMKSADGKPLEDNDVEIILKTAKDENKITLGDFIAILYRVKLYKKPHWTTDVLRGTSTLSPSPMYACINIVLLRTMMYFIHFYFHPESYLLHCYSLLYAL